MTIAGSSPLKARAWVSELISGDDGTLDKNSVMAIAELSFPGARPENFAQVIMHIADASAAARREPVRMPKTYAAWA